MRHTWYKTKRFTLTLQQPHFKTHAGELDFEKFKLIITTKLGLAGTASASKPAGWKLQAPLHQQLPDDQAAGSRSVDMCTELLPPEEWVREVAQGGCFGEASLVDTKAALEGSLLALDDPQLLVLGRPDYERILACGFDGQLKAKADKIAWAPILAGCFKVGRRSLLWFGKGD